MKLEQKIEKNQLLDQLMSIVFDHVPSGEHSVIEKFIRQFSVNPTYQDLKKIPLDRLALGLVDLWQFTKQRQQNVPKIQVYYWKPDFQTTLCDRIVINIVNDDMPFLVDSLTELLHSFDIKPRRIIHPVFKVIRDDLGNLTEILSQDQEVANSYDESMIHCEIIENISPEMVDKIKQELPKVLKHVRYATQNWQEMRSQTDVVIEEICQNKKIVENNQNLDEIVNFLNWVKQDHFTYLGYGSFDFISKGGKMLRHFQCHNIMGILNDENLQDLAKIFQGVTFNRKTRQYLMDLQVLLINKASIISYVHRGVALDALCLKKVNDQGQITGIHVFLGLFTSIAYDSSARDIPLLRHKISLISAKAGLSPNWHDGKSLIHILDSLPRDDLFQASIDELTTIGIAILKLQERPRVALFMRRDQFNRFLSCLVYIPRDRFDSDLCDRLGEVLAQELKGRVSDYKAQFGSLALARVHYIVYLNHENRGEINLEEIEQKLIVVGQSWLDDLKITLLDSFGDHEGAQLYRKYKASFSKGYQEKFQSQEIIQDIKMLEKIQTNQTLEARLYCSDEDHESAISLKVYHPKTSLPLSDILPILENLDLRILRENSFRIKYDNQPDSWIHDFKLESRSQQTINLDRDTNRFIEAFHAVRNESIENDGFNRLVLRAQLTIRQCLLLRIYFKYLKQIRLTYSRDYIESTLLKYPEITAKVVRFFEEKFDPSQAIDDTLLRGQILEDLKSVESPDEDKILRHYLNLVVASLRTNFYQTTKGKFKNYVSIKFDSHQIDELPLPKPKYEIYVYSTRFEAIHLRGGLVARGGIRWSDRFEDFRTEILGLMKAQTVKNTVIVPVGSKGGFVVKSHLINPIRDQIMAEGIECYQDFIRGLLDVTDNLVKGKSVSPEHVVCWDDADSYLVVAADKGTATFSDYANAVSREYQFWLDDAFASGGSAGYDHKKMAITARGAWVSVKRHFSELGTNINTTPFSVLGIGDMAGDVFGNGMLLSDKIQLVAAFNHQHIFIDPKPDMALSFVERQRLFDLPRSTWQDYDPALISEGGGVFERKLKIITLSPQIQTLLKAKLFEITPSELIKKLLTLNVDLLWFGGIGTFIKSSKESQGDVGDRNNDNVRINAKDLQCRVIGEGANLGVTQLGRIEFAQKGGFINTDAIDNSAGVDCSDHEVNLKILFNTLIHRHELSMEERNNLLIKMTSEVADLVLQDNFLQTQAISLIDAQGIKVLDEQIKLIRYLEGKGKLNRTIEYLPDDATFAEMLSAQKSLTRPEIAVLLAYAKIDYYEQILNSSALDDFALEEEVKSYFPKLIQENYKENILMHPLKREIVATLIINELVNYLGPSYLYDMMSKTGCQIEEAVKSYLVVRNAFELPTLWSQIESLEDRILPTHQMKVMLDVLVIVRRIMPWLIKHYHMNEGILTTTNVLKVGSDAFLENLNQCLDDQTKKTLEESIASYEMLNIGADLSQRIAVLQIAASSPDIILIAARIGANIPEVAKIYFEVGVRFSLATLRKRINEIKTGSSWQRMALNGAIEDLYGLQTELVEQILNLMKQENFLFSDAVVVWIAENQEKVNRIDQLNQDILSLPTLDLAIVSVILREYRNF
ncbi:MAG: NAD-glutamate dehydrogenase [Janthinobacterium lividum]